MTKFAPNVCCTTVRGKLVALRDQVFRPLAQDRLLTLELGLEDLAILELFSHERYPQRVYEKLQTLSYSSAARDLQEAISVEDRGSRLREAQALRLFLGSGSVVALPISGADASETVDPSKAVDLSRLSRKDPRVGMALFAAPNDLGLISMNPPADYDTYLAHLVRFFQEELLVPDVGTIDWGDLRRRQPLCQVFGYSRGTPVDRYYLRKFVLQIQSEVRGKVLEIGGRQVNRQVYGFGQATEYRTLELAGTADDIVGDASDPEALPEGRYDSIVAFHVLEHCERPQQVIDNMWRWLAPGGRAFVAVPASQKIHTFPVDFWRPLPDAVRSLFHAFSDLRLHIYGNLLAVVAGLCGIAAEEVGVADLDAVHPDYPVLVCAAARKQP